MVRVHFYPIEGRRQDPEELKKSLENYDYEISNWRTNAIGGKGVIADLDRVKSRRVTSDSYGTISYLAMQAGYEAKHRTGALLLAP